MIAKIFKLKILTFRSSFQHRKAYGLQYSLAAQIAFANPFTLKGSQLQKQTEQPEGLIESISPISPC